MEIVTGRLRLDALEDADAQALFGYRGDPEVSRYQGWKPASVADTLRFIEGQQGVAPDTPGTWWQRAIRLRDSGELIGDLGLHFLDDATVELGISLAPAQQRRGYAREAVEVMLDFVFGGLRKQRVVALVDRRNFRSMRLLEGLGMHRRDQQDGDVVFILHSHEWLAPSAGESDGG
ncbi:MAG TPA: GNAT family N-acetyltransferase [Rhodanobacteraceae bacterium]|nr:GNAT family N-acetyltransferase [Rhodanobacteraceae bacterium]